MIGKVGGLCCEVLDKVLASLVGDFGGHVGAFVWSPGKRFGAVLRAEL